MTFPYKGYAGYYLEVDLTSGKIHKKDLILHILIKGLFLEQVD